MALAESALACTTTEKLWGMPVADTSRAVFLSYASQDAAAAQRICEALRAAGIEVWFDQSELRGGEAWDRKIRKQIHDCALFIPVISANAHARVEGYFRLEWKLATDRSHLMAPDQTFLLPVVIDNTPQTDERIPDRFRELHWSRLPDGQVPPAFIERVQRLLSPVEPDAPSTGQPAPSRVSPSGQTIVSARPSWGTKRALPVVAAVLALGALAYFAVERFWNSKHPALPPTAPAVPASAAPTAFAPPPHSVAVLPFVNLSGDASQDYFSEGLTEELLNSLAQINNLQVAARTSSFSFKEHPDIGTVARKLNVGAVLEGSVRRSAHTVRVTAQLINTVTGFHLWSKTYDRDLGDVLRLQTEIATAVAGALQVTLLGDEAAKIELGGTRTAAAFDAYLRASKVDSAAANARDTQDAVTGYTEAIRLDPNYALAYAARSLAFASFATHYATGPAAVRATLDKAEIDAHKAIAIAPDLGPGHLALAVVFERLLDFRLAKEEYERALELDPGSARTLSNWGFFAVLMGHTDVGLTAQRRAVTLDPLNPNYYRNLGVSLQFAGRGDEAMAVFRSGQRVDPDYALINAAIGILEYLRGNFESARTTCEHLGGSEFDVYLVCLAITYDKLGRRGDAEASLAKLKAARGDAAASMYVRIYAQWGNRKQALDWLEMAMRLRDPELEYIKVVPLIDPLRQEPRFQAVERALKFPD